MSVPRDERPFGDREISKAARRDLGAYWGLKRELTPHELAQVLGLSGETATHTVMKWEIGSKMMTGPVLLALSLMTPPEPEEIDDVAKWVGGIEMAPDRTLADVLSDAGLDAPAVLDRIVAEAAAMLREPPGLDYLLTKQESLRSQHNSGVLRSVMRRRRREGRREERARLRGDAQKKIAHPS